MSIFRLVSAAVILACFSAASIADPLRDIDNTAFGCITEMTPVKHFFVDNLGDAEALAKTVEVATSDTGGVYPKGSIVQLVPTEVMIKRAPGFSPATRDWEFFELNVSSDGSEIRTRGFVQVENRFGGNCFACHIKARPEWDLICGKDHGCDPIALTSEMISALQKTDPRCEPSSLSEAESKALQGLQALLSPHTPKD